DGISKQAEVFKGKNYYSFFNTPIIFKNVSKYRVENIETTNVSCRAFQSSIAGYSISCTTDVKLSLVQNGSDKAVSEIFNIGSTFKSDEELVESLKDRLKEEIFDKYFKEKDPLEGKRKAYSKFIKTIEKRSIVVGMPESLIVQSWGEPNKINLYNAGKRKQYIYGDYYIYSEGGKVTDWQKF